MNDLARVEAAELDGTLLVRIRGEIDLSNSSDVMDRVRAAVPRDASVVVVDLSDTAYLDSSAIAMLFRLAERLRNNRQELRLVVPSPSPIRAVLELTSVHRVIPIENAVVAPAEQD
jgi:anti-anti-sigma factor